MKHAPFNILISGSNFQCHVTGSTEGEAADTAEVIMQQLWQREKVLPKRVEIECIDGEASQRLASYFAAVTAEPDLD
jgi:hypothetical protein